MTRNPIQVGPDQRYWRRRANRRVRKARRTAGMLRWGAILVVNAIVLLALVASVRKTVAFVRTTQEFALERIELRGIERASEAAILARVEPYRGRNILDLDLLRIERDVQRDPWIRRAAVRRSLPGTLTLTVEERHPVVLAVLRGRPHLVDDTGYVIGPAEDDATSLPVLVGLEGRDGDALVVALRRGVDVVERLRRANPSFAAEVIELDLAQRDRVALRTAAEEPQLLLDPDRVEQNLDPYLELREAIARRVGDADYVDLRWRDRISVMPVVNNETQ